MLVLLAASMASLLSATVSEIVDFPNALVHFRPHESNPVFEAAGPGHWDEMIRERGWILREDDGYHLWYTGYQRPESSGKSLGYATSPDGIHWTRHPGNPVVSGLWTEDVMVVKEGGTYYMFAEGQGDQAHLLSSTDRVHWTEQGVLDIRMRNGSPLSPGPFGTPAALCENGVWHLFYERNDAAIWLARSTDLKVWTNVRDEPVLRPGPESYDRTMVALNQVIRHEGRYYAYYHATCPENGRDRWSMNVAASPDLLHWTKYPGNPVLKPDFSSGLLVHDGTQYRLYCAHRAVSLFLPAK